MLTAPAVARELGISARAVYALAAAGALPCYRFGAAVRFAAAKTGKLTPPPVVAQANLTDTAR